jgi:hypothetical protein
MGFKADTSFLRFLSMGAAGARQLMKLMKETGFEPIELERYCTSNKIWTTKVKRLRLPDILCVKTGLRVEVRAKSDLQIRMSDAPANPERRWDVGMRDVDLAAFIACADNNGTPVPATEPVFFTYRDLRKSENQSRLGDPKAASEGTETARTWPSTVPKRNGVVIYVDKSVVRVTMDADKERPERTQSFALRGKAAYVSVGDKFTADSSIIAGAPARRADLKAYLQSKYDPLGDVAARDAVDRYAAVKALPFLPEKKKQALTAIEQRLDTEKEERVLLEAAGAGTALNSEKAWKRLQAFIWDQERADLRMEAVFILTELRSPGARDVLFEITADPYFADDEIRQAAVWGLGKAGLKSYGDLVPFLKDMERDVVLHAIAAFGADTSKPVVDQLVDELFSGDARLAPAASEALRIIGSDVVLKSLITAAKGNRGPTDWVLATLGRLPAHKVRAALQGDPLLERLQPLLLLSDTANWITEDTVDIDLKFLLKQKL